jgi:biopolymer transport protein TolQ
MQGFTILEMLLHGWPVLSVLLAASILSWTVMFERWLTYKRAAANAKSFTGSLIKMIESQGANRALEHCRRSTKPVAVVSEAILTQNGTREACERAMRHALQEQINGLESGISILATVGSMAPFVGLLGTVIGIIKAFRQIAISSGGGPEVVSAGIAEALVTTAAGLIVAIPAVIGYNSCVNRVQRMTDEIDLASYDLIETLANQTGRST